MKNENPIEEIWRIRDELAAEEGCDVHTVFEILRREEKKHGDRRIVDPARRNAEGRVIILRRRAKRCRRLAG